MLCGVVKKDVQATRFSQGVRVSVCGCVFFLRCRPVGGAQGLMMAAYCRNTVA